MAGPALQLLQGDPTTWGLPPADYTFVGVDEAGLLVFKQTDGTINTPILADITVPTLAGSTFIFNAATGRWENHRLTAGIGVSITNGNGSITISADGGANYQGAWDAATNTPTLVSSVGTKGFYYVVSVDGSTNLNGITDWKVGDWAIFNGSVWQKVDNTDAVTSIIGTANEITASSPTGAVTLSLPTALTFTGKTVTGGTFVTPTIATITAPAATNLTLNAGSGNQSLNLRPTGSGAVNIKPATNVTQLLLEQDNATANWGLFVDSSDGSLQFKRSAGAFALSISGANNAATFSAALNVTGANATNAASKATVDYFSGQGRFIAYGADASTVGVLSFYGLSSNASVGGERGRFSVGGNLLIGGTTDITGSGGLKVFGATAASGYLTGAFQVLGGAGLNGALWADGTANSTLTGSGLVVRGGNTTFSTNIAEFRIFGGTTAATAIAGDGSVRAFANVASTNTTTGSIVVGGGIGVSGAGYFGGRLNVSSAFSIPGRFESSDINASIQIHSTAAGANSAGYQLVSGGTGSVAGAGGFGIYDSGAGAIRMMISSAGVVNVPGTTSASSSIVGAFLVGNGTAATNVAIGGGNINAGGTGTFGNARASSWSLDSSLAFFGHQSAAGAVGTYALLQTAAGNTQLNGASTLTLGINNSTQLSLVTGAATFSGSVTSAGTLATWSAVPSAGLYGLTLGSMTGTNMYGVTNQNAVFTLNAPATEIIGYRNYSSIALGTNALTNWYGFQSTLNSKTGVGVLTNAYAFHAGSPTAATNNYAFYSTGTAPSVFGGGVTVGAAASFPTLTFGANSSQIITTSSTGLAYWDIASSAGAWSFRNTFNGSSVYTFLGTGYSSLAGSVQLGSASWRSGSIAIGPDGQDKVVIGPLISTTNGPTIGGHATGLGGWAPINVNGSTVTLRIGETAALSISAASNVSIPVGDLTVTNSIGITSGNITESVTNGTATWYVNYNGYQQSNTQFRNFGIYDGKRAEIAMFTGSTKAATFAGPVSITNTTASTNTTSGALQVAGGVGIAGSIFSGGIVSSTGGANFQNNSGGTATLSLQNLNATASSGVSFLNNTGTLMGAVAANNATGNLTLIASGGSPSLQLGAAGTVYLTIAPSGTATFSGQANFQASMPQIVLGAGSTAVNQIGFLYSSGGQYFGLSGNRNPATGIFPNTAGTHAGIDLDTGAAGSSITFRTTATPNTLGNLALFINKNQGLEPYGDIAMQTAGKTLSVKSGTNALAGTVTLVGGTATITSTAIDVNTVVMLSVKTASGTIGDHTPSIKVNAGNAVITGSSSDASTYNWIALKVS